VATRAHFSLLSHENGDRILATQSGEVFTLEEYEAFLCAALLHDIGKVYQRAYAQKTRHWDLSAAFVEAYKSSFPNAELVKVLVAHHHQSPSYTDSSDRPDSIEDARTRMLAYLISHADNFSASERAQSDRVGGYAPGTPLHTVFSQIDVGRSCIGETPETLYCYELGKIPEASTHPKQVGRGYQHPVSEYERHVDAFLGEFRTLFSEPYSHMSDTLLSLIQKYLWCIPSDVTRECSDISLADHSKATCALAACFYKFHEEFGWIEDSVKDTSISKALLVCGDLSGIQDYIYGTTSIGHGGVAKRLRGRSFRVGLLTELIATRMLHELGLPMACKIMAAGGQFYALVPNTQHAKNTLKCYLDSVQDWLVESYQGEITASFASTELHHESLSQGKFDEVLDELHDELSSAKLRRMESVFNRGSCVLSMEFQGRPACPVCDRRPAQGDDEALPCSQCELDAVLGQKLLSHKWLVISEKPFDKNSVKFLDNPTWYASLTTDAAELSHTNPIYCLNLKSSDLLPGLRSGFLPYPQYIPTWSEEELNSEKYQSYLKHIDREEEEIPEPGDIKNFSALAWASTGDDLLGVLRADVDHLGLVFSLGMRGQASLSRVTTLSTMLNLFFAAELPKLLRCEFRDTYVAYAGGDDLMLIGPWDATIRLSKRLTEEFAKFTANNPNLTISAAVGTYNPRVPIATSSVRTGELLEKSKSGGRDRLTVFDTTVTWADFSLLERWAEMLIRSLQRSENGISKAFLYRLFSYQKQAERYFDSGDDQALLFRPHLAYDIARNYTSDEGEPLLVDTDLYDALKSLLGPPEEAEKAWRILKAAIAWSSYATRERKED
jgi:CRISPR-associated protein Csm1